MQAGLDIRIVECAMGRYNTRAVLSQFVVCPDLGMRCYLGRHKCLSHVPRSLRATTYRMDSGQGDAPLVPWHIAGLEAADVPTLKAEVTGPQRGTSVVELSYVEKPISGLRPGSVELYSAYPSSPPHVETTMTEPARVHH
jgi:hypothetical protein